MTHLRHGQRWKQTADNFKHRCKMANLPCHICGQKINYRAKRTPDSFEADHFYPISQRPDLIFNESNLRPSHASCNNQRGNKPIEPQRRWVAANW
jgi:5-methylcytosine-specific restriction endonuclease McrA